MQSPFFCLILNNKLHLGSNTFPMGNRVPEILGVLSPLSSFKDGHDELISATSRIRAGKEALFSSGVAEPVGGKQGKL